MRTYLDPRVKLIDGTNYDLAFYTWLKSRKHVIKLEDGTKIKDIVLDGVDDLYFDHLDSRVGIMSKLCIVFIVSDMDYYLLSDNPGLKRRWINKFYVDNELVEYSSYREKIMKMNLQYNNFPQYTFEITGSALFRDFLYNINWSEAWACSNRFLFSVYNDVEVLDESMYPISSEYRGVPEWESQFDAYMKKIHETQITDDNRPEMPYSIASEFWWGCNHKTLISILSLMKLKFPFFYEVYGKLMMNSVGINELNLSKYVDYSLDQYFLTDWEKGSQYVKGFYLIDTEMDMIILSQFLRQSPSVISGLFNELEHNNTDEFVHKIFKGGTTMKIRFIASKARTLGTVSNRCCNFAANSGSGTGSWSGFLEDFLQSVNSTDELRSILPCKFDSNGLLSNCKMYQDVRFRLSGGSETRNCPCPLLTVSMNDAQFKLDRDKNKLGLLFYDLTKELVDKGAKPYSDDIEV